MLDAQGFTRERHESTAAMLELLVRSMSWQHGCTAVTRERLAEHADRSVGTVVTFLRWAQAAGLLVVVERGATAEYLGATRNRAQTYAVVAPIGDPAASEVDHCTPSPRSGDESSPQQGRVIHNRREHDPWPARDHPITLAEQRRAAERVFDAIELPGRLRARGHRMLVRGSWWASEHACPAAVVHALARHPDRPDQDRGNAVRGAADPLAVLGGRLTPWRGRLDELPPEVRGLDRAERLARRAHLGVHDPGRQAPPASAEVRAAALAACRAATRRPVVSA